VFGTQGIQEHVYSSILVNKGLLISPFTCRKNFQELRVEVLFPPFHEEKQGKENFIPPFQTPCDVSKT